MINIKEVYRRILNDELVHKADWLSLVYNELLSEKVINEFASSLNWESVLECQYISVECFIKNYEYIERDCINAIGAIKTFCLQNTDLSEDFIKKYIIPFMSSNDNKNGYNWLYILSQNKSLSESFIISTYKLISA